MAGQAKSDVLLANKKLKYTIKRDVTGSMQWTGIPAIPDTISVSASTEGVPALNTQTAANTGWNGVSATFGMSIYAAQVGTGVSMQGTGKIKLNGVTKGVVSAYCSGTDYCSGSDSGSFEKQTDHAAPNKVTLSAFIQNANATVYNMSLTAFPRKNDVETVMLTHA